MATATLTPHYWLPTTTTVTSQHQQQVDCLCLGTGRFLRTVLVPACVAAGLHPVLVQTRGRNFLSYMQGRRNCCYPVDTVEESGEVSTQQVACFGAFSLGKPADKQAFYDWLCQQQTLALQLIGVGVTEAGLASAQTTVMQDLYELLQKIQQQQQTQPTTDANPICVINMDNVPHNGAILRQHMETLATDNPVMLDFIHHKLVFCDTMVDRITSSRPGSDGLVPRAEPSPAKALVILDHNPQQNLPPVWRTHLPPEYGVVVRTKPPELVVDTALKLRIANGTHTAVAHALALCRHTMTDVLSSSTSSGGALWMQYLDALFETQILASGVRRDDNEVLLPPHSDAAREAYQDWRKRLMHPHFGLSTFFITQNGPRKGGIRLGPTVRDLILVNDGKTTKESPVSVAMAFAFAALLRWLTPVSSEHASSSSSHMTTTDGVFRGWLPEHDTSSSTETVEYADQLRHNLSQGWYEFKCACSVLDQNGRERNLSRWLGQVHPGRQPAMYAPTVRAYLVSSAGGDLADLQERPAFDDLVNAIATLYARMIAGDDLVELLTEMKDNRGVYLQGMATSCSVLVDCANHKDGPLHYRPNPVPDASALMKVVVDGDTLECVVVSEVASAMAVDVHTHLLPPSHGALCLWGIDELLTYVSFDQESY